MAGKKLPDANVLPDVPPRTYTNTYQALRRFIKKNFSDKEYSFFDQTSWRHIKTVNEYYISSVIKCLSDGNHSMLTISWVQITNTVVSIYSNLESL